MIVRCHCYILIPNQQKPNQSITNSKVISKGCCTYKVLLWLMAQCWWDMRIPEIFRNTVLTYDIARFSKIHLNFNFTPPPSLPRSVNGITYSGWKVVGEVIKSRNFSNSRKKLETFHPAHWSTFNTRVDMSRTTEVPFLYGHLPETFLKCGPNSHLLFFSLIYDQFFKSF